MPDPTTNYEWDKPNVAGDSGAWGTLLNAILDDLDTELAATDAVADAALARAGGSMTGEIDILTARYVTSNLGASLSGTVNLDLDAANMFYGTLAGNITITFSNVPAATDFVGIVLEITGGGSLYTVTWPAAVKWPSGTAPTFTASEVQVIVMYTRDGGTTWRAALAMGDSS